MGRILTIASRWNTIRHRIFFSILLFLVIPFILTFYWVDKPLEHVIEEKIGESARETLYQVNLNVGLFLDDMLKQAVDISTNPSITELLKEPDKFSEYEKLRLKDTVINKQYSSYYTDTYVTLMDVYGHWQSTRYMEEGLYRLYTEAPWYREMLGRPFQLRWMFTGDNYVYSDRRPLITLVKTITELQTSQNIGMLLFGVAEKDIRKYLTPLDGQVYLIDQAGTVVSSPAEDQIGRNVAEENYISRVKGERKGQVIVQKEGKKWIVNYDTVAQNGWKIVQIISYDTVFKEIFNIRRANIIIVLLIFFVFMMITLSISFSISRPLKLLNKRMQEAEERDFNSVLLVTGPQEINTLISTYNKMVRQIRELLQRLKEQYQQKEDMRFRALQAQINPHFILNTINNIKWMAYIRNERDIGDMLSNLGGMLEASIGRGDSLITLRQEMSYIENYMALMRLKYNDKLLLKTDIPETCWNQEVIKTMLQPIVENSILHGIEPLPGQGEIAIRSRIAEDRLLLSVEDNGAGMTPERLREVQEWLADTSPEPWSKRIGIKNVHERIRLQYGHEYGLVIQSELNKGTKVQVILPVKLVEEGREYDR
ncbi:sensor histidine kinase [Paenibacillus doosanensis]|uniref:sensor histidine kinase n=1 Tax=Paenibacillus doosanensis TaxID=1229154 RepID=UPI00217F689B|nr:sensor histidine kinase [Paenibacillus doosanensis]MCS7464790.1 sensor histidine kinase [Paenibacillus doosanensis]